MVWFIWFIIIVVIGPTGLDLELIKIIKRDCHCHRHHRSTPFHYHCTIVSIQINTVTVTVCNSNTFDLMYLGGRVCFFGIELKKGNEPPNHVVFKSSSQSSTATTV